MQMKQAFTRGSSFTESAVFSALSGNLIVSSFISILLDAEEDGLELEVTPEAATLEAVVGEDEAGAITRIAFNHFAPYLSKLEIQGWFTFQKDDQKLTKFSWQS